MSKRHHYLPQFYLKGFLNGDEQLYYYRKDEVAKEHGHEIYKKSYTRGIYYEEGLNYIDFGRDGYENIDLEETFFMEKDNCYSKAFSDMKNKYDYDISKMPLQIKADIVEFVLGLYWRVPGRWERFKAILQEDGLLTGLLPLVNKETGHVYTVSETPEVINIILTNEINQKILMPYFYEQVIMKHNWEKLNDKFLIFETYKPLLIGDIPYIPLKSENKRNKILEEFVIPLDKNHILFYADKKPNFLEENLFQFITTCIVDGASEKISCNDIDYLRNEIKKINRWINHFKKTGINDIKEKMMRPFIEFESTFKTVEDFQKYHKDQNFVERSQRYFND